MIATVVIQDLAWLAVIALMMYFESTREQSRIHPSRAFDWLFFAFCYVSLELLFHVPMENAVAWVMGVAHG